MSTAAGREADRARIVARAALHAEVVRERLALRDDAVREAIRAGAGIRELSRATGLSPPAIRRIRDRG